MKKLVRIATVVVTLLIVILSVVFFLNDNDKNMKKRLALKVFQPNKGRLKQLILKTISLDR
ncbi:MAG: hypothetical protein LRY71_17665 [Bacillaceae bacterium]|nr:hypothetical protein [Bacillaceae bacterium]